MKKMFSKKVILSFALVLALCIGMLPLMAFTSFADENLSGNADCCEFAPDVSENLDFSLSNAESSDEVLELNSTSAEIIASIKSESPFSVRGTVIKDGVRIDANEYYDFSSLSRFDIAAWASEKSYITEAEKIDCYCDLYINRNFENIYCLTTVVDEIAKYRDSNLLTAEMSAKIDRIFERPFGDELETEENVETRDVPSISNKATCTTTNFKVHYDKKQVTSTFAGSVAGYFQDVREIFVEEGYNTPILETLRTRYQVYLYNGTSSQYPNALGVCFGTNSSTKTTSSYIVLYLPNFDNPGTLDNVMREVICHEYFHAIQNAYNKYSNWFKEACAEWAVLNNLGTDVTIRGKIETFLSDNEALSYWNEGGVNQYGAVLYVLTIERNCGGENTIRKIYEAFNGYSATPTDAQFRAMITEGISDAGYSNNFISVFRSMTVYNCNPGFWYKNVFSGSSAWACAISYYLPVYASATASRSGSLEPLQSIYYELQIASNVIGDLSVTSTSASSASSLQIYEANDTSRVCILAGSSNPYTSTEILFDHEDYYKIIVIVSNVGTATTNYTLNISLATD